LPALYPLSIEGTTSIFLFMESPPPLPQREESFEIRLKFFLSLVQGFSSASFRFSIFPLARV